MSEMTKFGADLIQSMSEALAHAQRKDVPGIKVHSVDVGAVDAKAIRKKLDLTQDEMATVLGTSPSGYKKWEQGKRQPSGAARTLLRIMEKEPEAVLRALSSKDELTDKQTPAAAH
ncbi:MAG: helix-turn-helix domain-containing protein [Mesorhizobium sp.]|uniref:helix-turn-helix domain-containing protein n=1 Tax=Mesorhizobium sp. TaxID=1871066 RepID=UPI00120FD0F9|nr:helix-turn-helix domain-containing protein [Mesorhizobium sp.]TIR49075.1 MAG: helix-turn-helix domain-containing protein [Mesorhizobium sp.]